MKDHRHASVLKSRMNMKIKKTKFGELIKYKNVKYGWHYTSYEYASGSN